MEEFESLGHKFIEIDLDDDVPNVTVTSKGTPLVLVRQGKDEININVLDWPGTKVNLHRNNSPVYAE